MAKYCTCQRVAILNVDGALVDRVLYQVEKD